jgi:predicted transcriptional regulator
MQEVLSDPVFAGDMPPAADVRLTASNAPILARAFIALHQSYRQAQERLASLDEALGREDARATPSPWEEVRDFFHYCDNYIDAIDHAAERFAGRAKDPSQMRAIAIDALAKAGLTVEFTDMDALRMLDADRAVLHISSRAQPETQTFQLLLQVALRQQNSLLEATLDLARFSSEAARDIAKIGLANYFAGAALLPYGAFQDRARSSRHDLEVLARHFGASIEQVAHRLSTLQRPGAKGLPFFFVRVDQAGTITKRHSATRLQFARFGGACPLWNVHRAFETPGKFLRQLAETPDGIRYISIARDISKSAGRYGAPTRRFALALGCEVRHASQLVYADGLDLRHESAFEPIGISCRICSRTNCHQRAVPPLERNLVVDPDRRDVLPYRVD